MQLAIISLLTGLIISAVAIYYSVVGLTAIFAAAAIPIMVMGVALEVAKLVATVWLKQNWKTAPFLIKTYLVSAVAVLMFITSMGIFGFLSKAHMDQNLVSGDVQSKIAIYDQKIQTSKENIESNRKALKQMDEAVDQSMARSTDEKGADKAVAIRRGQQKERVRLQNEIAQEQKTIAQLNDEAAPIRAEVRKVEAEVGPIKYIAAFVYGDNPDANILEKAVTWVIVIIVFVFDPLAVILLLASQYSFARYFSEKRGEVVEEEEQEEKPTWAQRIANKIKNVRTSTVDAIDTIKHSIKSPIVHKQLDEPVILAEPTPVENAVDLDYVNQQLAEAAVVEEPVEPIEIAESVDFDELKNKLAVFREALIDNAKTEVEFAEFNPQIKGFTVPKVNNVAPLAKIESVKFDNNDELVIPDNLDEMTESQIKQWNELLANAERAVLDEQPVFPNDPFLGQQFTIENKVYIYNGNDWIYTPKSGEQGKFQLIPELEKHIEERAYVQNEEQTESNLWQETRNNVHIENAHSLSQEDYQEKVQLAIVRDLVDQINNGTISIDDLTEAETIAVEAYLRKESDAG